MKFLINYNEDPRLLKLIEDREEQVLSSKKLVNNYKRLLKKIAEDEEAKHVQFWRDLEKVLIEKGLVTAKEAEEKNFTFDLRSQQLFMRDKDRDDKLPGIKQILSELMSGNLKGSVTVKRITEEDFDED